jgi:hypothetical protein
MLKIIFKKQKKYYFDAFPSKKHFEKQPQPYSQTKKNAKRKKKEEHELCVVILFFKKKNN